MAICALSDKDRNPFSLDEIQVVQKHHRLLPLTAYSHLSLAERQEQIMRNVKTGVMIAQLFSKRKVGIFFQVGKSHGQRHDVLV